MPAFGKLPRNTLPSYQHPPPPPEEYNKPKELIIFVVYLNTYTESNSKEKEIVETYMKYIGKTFKEIERHTNYLIKFFLFPTKEETRMECIFPPRDKDDIDIHGLLPELEESKNDNKGFTLNEDEEDEEEGEEDDIEVKWGDSDEESFKKIMKKKYHRKIYDK